MTNQSQPEPTAEAVAVVVPEPTSATSPGTRKLSVQFKVPEDEENSRSHSVASTQSECKKESITISAEQTRESVTVSEKVNHHEGIYWRSPISMVAFFLFGVLASLMHHVYYHSLDGKQVGNDSEQQWALRWGTTFAYLTQISLVTSIGFAYTQWLWLDLKKRKISVAALDAAMSADASLVSLFNLEMIGKIRIGSFLALVIGLLPLTSLVPPATLFVLPDIYYKNATGPVPVLDIPRSIVSRLSSATASLGQILPIPPPNINATYNLQFYGPSVQCSEADNAAATIIANIRDEAVAQNTRSGSINETNYYYAFVPDLMTNFDNKSAPDYGVVTAVSQYRLSQAQAASNELWMTFARYSGKINSKGRWMTEDQYLVCKLFNASFNLLLSFEEGVQNITDNGTQILNTVEYPGLNETLSDALLVQHAYSAVFWAMSDLLVGSMSFFKQNSTPPTNFTEIKTELQYISLLGSSDLQAFIDSNHPDNTTIGDQRAQDIALVRNRTLEQLIPELMFNITATFMSSNLLSPPINMTYTRWDSINTYVYHTRNLFLSYGLAIALALLANLLAAYAYQKNGVSYNKTFSAMLAATRDISLTELFHYEVVGRLPLSKKVRKALLSFGNVGGRRGSLGGTAEQGFVRAWPDDKRNGYEKLLEWLGGLFRERVKVEASNV